ncbi:MAG: glycosyltransferase family 4 protein [Desulfuromonadaceae bacterium]
MVTDKPVILVFLGFYLPGYKAGGPLRTIANMVDHLIDDFEFWVVTRDRDLGDTSHYADIKPNQWLRVGATMVYYLSPGNCTVRKMAHLIAGTKYDALYLNSFFEPVFTIKPLLARKFGWLPNKPVIIAPRGEFSTGAIKLKYLKKIIYTQIAKLFQLYENVIWQASSEHEAQDIVRALNVSTAAIHIALDLPACACPVPIELSVQSKVDDAALRIVFLSRISPMKNLDYALRVLCQVKANVVFDIYGPTEDTDYWERCTELLKQLPPNVKVNYFGSAHPDQVAAIFGSHDLFFFPTRGENYGHVIAEALSVGTPVLLSDQTPWRDLQTDRMGWDLPLEDMEQFIRIIDSYSNMVPREKTEWREHIVSKIVERLNNPQVFEANRELFRRAIQN